MILLSRCKIYKWCHASTSEVISGINQFSQIACNNPNDVNLRRLSNGLGQALAMNVSVSSFLRMIYIAFSLVMGVECLQVMQCISKRDDIIRI